MASGWCGVAGYRLMRSSVLKNVQWECGRHEFCAELLLKPYRLGYTVTEVSTKWVNRPEGESKNAFLRNLKFASTALRIRFRSPVTFTSPAPRTSIA